MSIRRSIIIVVAFIGTFVTAPFGLQRDQIFLGLLAFLAIDALIERLEVLTNIEKDVQALKELVASQASGKDLLRLRRDFPRMDHLIAEAKREIWVSGIALDSMARVTDVFNSALGDGINLRFLAIGPKENVLKEASD